MRRGLEIFPATNSDGPKCEAPALSQEQKGFQKCSLLEQRVLSARGVKLGGADPGAGLFAAGGFIGERKATLPVCKSEESLIKLIFCC